MAMFIAYVFYDLRRNGNLFFPLRPFMPNQLVLGRPMGALPAAVISLACALIGLFAASGNWRYGLEVSLVWAFICLSFVVLTGFNGQI